MSTFRKDRLPKFKLLDWVYDSRQPDRVGRFNGWVKSPVCVFAIVKFPHGGGQVNIPAEFVVSRRIANGRRLGEQYVRQRRLARLAAQNHHLQPLADKFGLTVEEYLDAIS